jgi:hypothetical protein
MDLRRHWETMINPGKLWQILMDLSRSWDTLIDAEIP